MCLLTRDVRLLSYTKQDFRLPVYGCYVVGRFHFFVVINGKEYAVSKAFDSTDFKDILQIFKMMRFVKHEIDKHFE